MARKTSVDRVDAVLQELGLDDHLREKALKKLAGIPEDGISISEASRKYGRPTTGTICRWIRRGYIRVLKKTPREVYISETDLRRVLEIYDQSPGQGSRILENFALSRT